MNICEDCKNTGIKLNGAPCYNKVHEEFVSEKQPTEQRDVHTEHCCLVHGCKYGYDQFKNCGKECTVSNGEKEQSYPCESCDWAKSEDNARMQSVNGKLVKIPSLVDFMKQIMNFVWDVEHGFVSSEYQIRAHELRLQYERDYK